MKKVDPSGRILIAGDLFPIETNLSFFSSGNVESLFGTKICSLFSDADLTICNLEGALTDQNERCVKTGPIKVAPASAVHAYKRLGIDYCLLANNHVTDGGHQGLLETMRTLDEAGIGYIGAGQNKNSIARSFIKNIKGILFGIYSVSERMYNEPGFDHAGVWLYDEYLVCQEIRELRSKCDQVIVLYHGGIEKFQYPSPELRKRFHRMADCGADVVIAQHTHCIGSEEYYNGSYLLYGQGDFLLNDFAHGLTDTGLLLELDCSGDTITIKKHLIRSENNLCVRYDAQQDLSSFNERSRMVSDEDYVWKQFQSFCDHELHLYLTAFKSPSRLRLLQKRFFPKSYDKWLFGYRKRDLMFALHTLRSEQNRETAIVGLEHFLDSGMRVQ